MSALDNAAANHEPTINCVQWDAMVESSGIDTTVPGWMVLAREQFGPRPMGPNKKASSHCESGKRDYCTCDTCF